MIESQKNRETNKFSTRLLVFVIASAIGLMPLILYFFIYGQTEMVTPAQAKDLLLMENSNAVLIDIRPKEEYNAAHIDGSYHWFAEEIFSLQTKEQVPEKFQDKTLLLICEAGILSNFAAKHLAGKGVQKAHDVIRKHVEFLDIDRPLYKDHNTMKQLVRSCEILENVEEAVGEIG